VTPVRDLNNLYFFAQVVDFGSYTTAAKALGLQTSKLSRRIAALESELGVRLINRTTRRLSLTEAGKTFHRHCLALLDEAHAARDAISQILASPQGLVRISCPIGLLQGGLANILARFLAKYPGVVSRSTPPTVASTSSTKASTSHSGYASRRWKIPILPCAHSVPATWSSSPVPN
jgi:DNA-binding transcriptional LysR family regulator